VVQKLCPAFAVQIITASSLKCLRDILERSAEEVRKQRIGVGHVDQLALSLIGERQVLEMIYAMLALLHEKILLTLVL